MSHHLLSTRVHGSPEHDPTSSPNMELRGGHLYWIRKPFKFIVQFEHHCKMARIPLMIAGTVVVLLCVLEIHAVIIAQRDISCKPSTLPLLLISA